VVLLLSVSFSFKFFPFEKKEKKPTWVVSDPCGVCWAIKKKEWHLSLSLVSGERENFQPVMHLPHLIVCTTQICNTSNNRMGKKERPTNKTRRTELIESAHLSTNLIFLSPQLDSSNSPAGVEPMIKHSKQLADFFPPQSNVRRWGHIFKK
jgi:hypothetical protein